MTVQAKKETMGFQAEVKQLLHLMVHSLYSNKEIFLRELISNASDAADRLRFEALGNNKLFENDSELKIWIDIDKDKRTLTVRDNGIGMTRDELISNLGTIAKSGTKEFLSTLTGDKVKDSKLIGQFGVGFYSAFIVAEKIVVTTRKAGLSAEDGFRWISTGQGEYDIEPARKSQRGTEITVYLKPEEDEFLNDWHVRHIIKKYSDHITLPIVMKKSKDLHKEQEQGNSTAKAQPKDPKIIEIPEEEVVNRATALWTLAKSEITDDQYKELYKHIAHDFEDPLTWTHNKVEGKLEYTMLLYLPSRAPFDLWHSTKARGLKLYVRRVFIMDDAEQFLPHYLRMVRGIIDSNDLPLNISREILQSHKTIDTIRSAVIKRVLAMLEQLAEKEPEKYSKFWKEFGQVLKEGPAEDFANKEQIAKLLRFSSTKDDSEMQTVALTDYLARMQEGQEKIYYVAAETFNAAKNSPHLEIFRKKGIEVLLLSDRVDEWLMAHLTEFSGKQLQSVAKGKLELGKLADADKQELKELEQQATGEFKDILAKIKTILADEIKEVRLTKRLTTSPACIVADEHDMTPQMERIMRAAGQNVPKAKPILELNPEHALVKNLQTTTSKNATQSDEQRFIDLTHLIFEQAVLAEGGQLTDPAGFVQRLNKLLLEKLT